MQAGDESGWRAKYGARRLEERQRRKHQEKWNAIRTKKNTPLSLSGETDLNRIVKTPQKCFLVTA
eukprot:3955996-Prymnesium_polylepis.1